MVPLKASRLAKPWMPATLPRSVFCQSCQSAQALGTFGQLTPEFVIHSDAPRLLLLPSRLPQTAVLVSTTGVRPVAACTVESQVSTRLSSLKASWPSLLSTARMGGRVPLPKSPTVDR